MEFPIRQADHGCESIKLWFYSCYLGVVLGSLNRHSFIWPGCSGEQVLVDVLKFVLRGGIGFYPAMLESSASHLCAWTWLRYPNSEPKSCCCCVLSQAASSANGSGWAWNSLHHLITSAFHTWMAQFKHEWRGSLQSLVKVSPVKRPNSYL